MSLIYCPECGHEISAAAVACPSCGRPIQARPVVERKVIATGPREESSFPKWAIIPIVVVGGLLLLFAFFLISRNSDDSNENLRVNVRTTRGANGVDTASTTDSQTVTVPPASDGSTITEPGSSTTVPSATSAPGYSQTVPGTQTSANPASTKATVRIEAKVAPATANGQPRAVRNERFYLLDKDLETILSDADIEPIEGNSLTNSLGLSMVYPDRFGDFNRKALRAIKEHIKYAGTTNSAGTAELGGIEPDSYYLFGITKVGRGFAVWSSPVSITTGENILNLTPARITEMQDSGE